MALRTQQILAYETGVAHVADPLGGSYYMESLTNEIENRIWDRVLDIESRGDPADLADRGWFRELFQAAMTRYGRQIEDGQVKKIGLNCLQIPEEEDTLLRKVAEEKIEPYRERIDRVKAYKDSRETGELKEVLRQIREEAGTEDKDLMPPILQAWKTGATMGEIGGMLRMAYDFPYDPHGFLDPPV